MSSEDPRVLREVVIPGAEGRAIEVRAGEYLSIIDLEGQQVADFVAIQTGDRRRHLSVHQTRSAPRRWQIQVGDQLLDNDRAPMFEIVRDDVGVHDLFFSACSPNLYLQRFGLTDHRSCRMILYEALAPHGVADPLDVPDPINIFMDSPPQPDGNFAFNPAPSKPGDRIVLRCLVDCIAAVSACPMDLSPINGGASTSLKLEVSDGA
jgi:uncharacterized protein